MRELMLLLGSELCKMTFKKKSHSTVKIAFMVALAKIVQVLILEWYVLKQTCNELWQNISNQP